MKLTILLASLLFAATSAKGLYVEGATTDSSVKLGANEAPRRGLGGQSDDRRMDQTAEAVVAAAKLGANEAPAANHRQMPSASYVPDDFGSAANHRQMPSASYVPDLYG